MARLIFSLLPSLSLIASSASSVLPPINTNTNTPKIEPRVPSHYPCDCFLVSGPDPGYFTDYKLWDFRSVPLPYSLNHGAYRAAAADLWEAETVPLSQSGFKSDWQAQSWSRHKTLDSIVPMVNSDLNAFFARHPQIPDASQLVLRTTRLSNYSSTAEIESHQGNFYRCSLRIRMRLMSREAVSRSPIDPSPHVNQVPKGACAGIFTYRSATCESDLEFLTSDPPNTVHYANQPDYDPVNDIIIPNASSVVTTLPSPWSAWITHRMDWLSNSTTWYVDDELQANITYGVPDRPSILALNLWSDGGIWTGDMKTNESVYMGIEWIEIAFNTSAAGVPPLEHSQRVHHRPLKSERRGSSRKRQLSGFDAAAEKCKRPCYLDKI
ncbi:concanavalin A-like lectin/glucanase domain-containing protein [Aspergillus pseudoustus]|uniref:Concanavalin A-like lectin/glucanase domain-containing protein n=1 Tax=Aspergillus pseudoustus TaxID=1810923 RepID=A0ABR4JYD3_9EURO